MLTLHTVSVAVQHAVMPQRLAQLLSLNRAQQRDYGDRFTKTL